jgi:hypothetical protein
MLLGMLVENLGGDLRQSASQESVTCKIVPAAHRKFGHFNSAELPWAPLLLFEEMAVAKRAEDG